MAPTWATKSSGLLSEVKFVLVFFSAVQKKQHDWKNKNYTFKKYKNLLSLTSPKAEIAGQYNESCFQDLCLDYLQRVPAPTQVLKHDQHFMQG